MGNRPPRDSRGEPARPRQLPPAWAVGFRPAAWVASAALLLQCGCSSFQRLDRTESTPQDMRGMSTDQVDQMRARSPFLRAHLPEGGVYILNEWSLDEARQHVQGGGVQLGPGRDTLATGWFRVSLDSVALLESNSVRTSSALAPILLLTAVTAGIAVYCITNPKACFGSCPTFYVPDGDSLRLSAEGFSASIAPALEAADVDALFRARPRGGELAVEMRNEALETHVVRQVNLLAARREPGHRVLAALDGSFWDCDTLVSPLRAAGPEGDCTELLARADGRERFSHADSSYLGAKEELELVFPAVAGDSVGLLVGCRQTLLSTYLLYQTLAYMGDDAGRWLARMHRPGPGGPHLPIQQTLGGLEVRVPDAAGEWQTAGEVSEYGPLATDFHLVPLPGPGGAPQRVRLRMARGNWRVDYVALARLTRRATPVRLAPCAVERAGRPDPEALGRLRGGSRPLTTLPGDRYTLRYRLPGEGADWDLFLESRGYYLEWMRSEWIAEQSPARLAEVLLAPEAALRRLAPEYARNEAAIEDQFWRSRYARP